MYNMLRCTSHVPLIAIVFFLSMSLSKAYTNVTKNEIKAGVVQKTIIVDVNGKGDFTSVQKAIDSVPENNQNWVQIHLRGGIYQEKIFIPQSKPYIVLSGDSSKTTTIRWNQSGLVNESATFTLRADNFVARNVSFKNSYNLKEFVGPPVWWAPAAIIYSDKVSFYRCSFSSVQDTLTDMIGRHYYKECYIEGAVDFIWGYAQSTYDSCVINSTAGINLQSPGYIVANGGRGPNENSGFVFVKANMIGSGKMFLGRAYDAYSRVVIFRSYIGDFVVPEGWGSGNAKGHEDTVTFVEANNNGPGADTSKRVNWMKKLTPKQLKKFTNINNFINQDGWIEQQPLLQ